MKMNELKWKKTKAEFLEAFRRLQTLKAQIHFLTQSCDQISCCGKPVQ